jgi:hypothetical protein
MAKNSALPMVNEQALIAEPKFELQVRDPRALSVALGRFLDITATVTGRATAYNSKAEQEAAEIEAHNKLFIYDRTLYGALLTLPGVTDRAKQMGLLRLLKDRTNGNSFRLSEDTVTSIEDKVLGTLVEDVTVPRMMKAFVMLRDEKINNARTRRVALRALLKNKGLEIRVVRYREKFGDVLRHIFGHKKASVLRAILERPRVSWERHETKFVKEQLGRYARFTDDTTLQVCVAYALGSDSMFVQTNESTKLIKAVFEARRDLKLGKDLPLEVLEGIRSQYHKSVKRAEVLEMASKSKAGMTDTQRMQVQASAQKAGVTNIDFDATKQDAVKLYIYAFERGLTEDIIRALDEKAALAAAMLPTKVDKVGILVDDSESNTGDETQKLRPMAVALATRDVLAKTGEEAVIKYTSGKEQGRLVRPSGDSSLAEGLVEVLLGEPDVVYVISDGYENAPAGRFAETVMRVRDLGITTPIIQISPVAAAEVKDAGLRQLTDEVKTVPVSNPTAMASSMLRTLVEVDPVKAVSVLMKIAFEKKALGNIAEVKKLEG